jgi:hypothetical protein
MHKVLSALPEFCHACIMNSPRNLYVFGSVAVLFVAACGASGDGGSQTLDAQQPDTDAVDTDAVDTSGQSDAVEPDDVVVDASDVLEAPVGCVGAGTSGATAQCLRPTQTPEYYVEQALKYFDTLDTSADRESIPNYSELSARWEWPPWLRLTGYGAANMLQTAETIRQFEPSTVPERDCRFFDVQPFARCYVVFEYEEGRCPIYEEFVFNDAGEMTFIEAWSDIDGLRPTSDADRWGEAPEFVRLSTRVPGLGRPDGLINIEGAEMQAAAALDPDIADFVVRARDFWGTWFAEVAEAGDGYFARGCGWE